MKRHSLILERQLLHNGTRFSFGGPTLSLNGTTVSQSGTTVSQNGTSLSLERSGSTLFSMEPADASDLPSEATKISSGTLKRLADNGVCKLFPLSGETMLKDLNTQREVLSGHAQGISLERIHRITGVPKTTVKRIIDQSKS